MFPHLPKRLPPLSDLEMIDANCIFCKIAAGDIPAEKVHEDDLCVIFRDLTPQAPHHFLIIPREHIDSLDKAASGQTPLLGHMLFQAAETARELGFAEDGYRVVVNTNSDGGQTVFHLHIHLLGGREFTFPPG